MKKIFAILLLITQFSCSKPKPEGLILKMVYQPGKTYNISTIRGTESVVTYSGQDIAMRKLKSMRVKNPTISKVRTKADTELVTGKSQPDNSFPVSLTYKKMMSLDGKNEIPVGTAIRGEIVGENLPHFSTVTSGELSFDQKALLLESVRNTFEQLDFPQQLLKVGDQFSKDRTGSMQIEGSEVETVVTTTYKLIGIKNNIAQFDLSQSYRMTPKMMDNSFVGKGNGNGRLTYDIGNKLVTEYTIKTELAINKKLDYYEFDLKTINDYSLTTQIVK